MLILGNPDASTVEENSSRYGSPLIRFAGVSA
jgi:hypothetical protein